jgi:hypothetical protein
MADWSGCADWARDPVPRSWSSLRSGVLVFVFAGAGDWAGVASVVGCGWEVVVGGSEIVGRSVWGERERVLETGYGVREVGEERGGNVQRPESRRSYGRLLGALAQARLPESRFREPTWCCRANATNTVTIQLCGSNAEVQSGLQSRL